MARTRRTTLKAAPEAAPEAAAVWVEVDKLLPWAQNPRQNDAAVDEVVASIKRFGFGAPLLARRENGEIIAGHTRLRAALKLQLPKVPVRYLDLDPADAHLLALADNKLGEIAEWDEARLGQLLAELRADGADILTGTGFDDGEIATLIAGASESAQPVDGQDPGAQEPSGHAVSVYGEIYQLGPHRLLCGDSTNPDDVKRLMDGERAVMCCYHTRPGDFCYEPFGGSGTHIIAAAKTGRRCYSIEQAPEFVDAIRRRWTIFARSAGIDPGAGALE